MMRLLALLVWLGCGDAGSALTAADVACPAGWDRRVAAEGKVLNCVAPARDPETIARPHCIVTIAAAESGLSAAELRRRDDQRLRRQSQGLMSIPESSERGWMKGARAEMFREVQPNPGFASTAYYVSVSRDQAAKIECVTLGEGFAHDLVEYDRFARAFSWPGSK